MTGAATIARAVRASCYSAADFVRRKLPETEWVVEGWICHPSIGMLYAQRGCGKTFAAMHLATCVARGEPWHGLPVPAARSVLYVDGEMATSDMRDRLLHVSGGNPPSNLYLLCSEDVARHSVTLDLANAEHRHALSALLGWLYHRHDVRVEFLVLDNWSSLMWSIRDDNDLTEISEIRKWLVKLRHAGCSVFIVHHAGKNGEQRGTSAREDNLNYSLRLTKTDETPQGTDLNIQLDKCRGPRPFPDYLTFRVERSGGITPLNPRSASPEKRR